MRDTEVQAWFNEYLSVFAACGRGEQTPSAILPYYDVPLVLSTDAGFVSLSSTNEVLTMVTQQVEAMRAAAYDHSEVLDAHTTSVNAVSAFHHGRFSRRRADGVEINTLAVTYLISRQPAGQRISALLVHAQVE